MYPHRRKLFHPRLTDLPRGCSSYPHSSRLLMNSYGEVAAFAHFGYGYGASPLFTPCTSSLESVVFDNEGRFIISMTDGCITIHNFYKLSQQAKDYNPKPGEFDVIDNTDPFHIAYGTPTIPTGTPPVAIMWRNTTNQFAFSTTTTLSLYDVNRFEIADFCSGVDTFEDIASSSDGSLIAAGGDTVILWDPRQGKQPMYELKHHNITSIQFDKSDQNIFFVDGSRNRNIYRWDIRASSMDAALPQHIRALELPETTPQGVVIGRFIRSIRFNPDCSFQLAFVTGYGVAGVFDTDILQMTHCHSLYRDKRYHYGKPSWLHACSVFALPINENIRLLDFHHSPKSPSHVDYIVNAASQRHIYRDVRCSQKITTCSAHPSYNVIAAGNMRNALEIVSQRKLKPEEEEKEEEEEEEEK
ncbi:Transducin/WD40 repeat superfamily protein [Trifolium repens]|nr:Transducin/WD40 repeat superfamily protein [Trifolium repens]